MEVQVRGRDIQITDGLRSFVERRTEKLDQLLDRVLDAKLELHTQHNRAGGDVTTAQLTIQTGRHILRAEERDHDPQRAVAMVVDTMVRQIRRHRSKRADRKWARAGLAPALAEPLGITGSEHEVEVEDEDEDEPLLGLVRTKRFSVKPMDPEEAIEQMELLDHDFYLFLNAAEDELNVVYRRRDGAYGLLSPEPR